MFEVPYRPQPYINKRVLSSLNQQTGISSTTSREQYDQEKVPFKACSVFLFPSFFEDFLL
jgi:hypothetical protein